MNYLLDVNILVAWGWMDHVDHERTAYWIREKRNICDLKLFTSSIPEIGFVRVSVQRAMGRVTLSQAAKVLRGMLQSLGKSHQFLPDNLDGRYWPSWCTSATRTTDAHLTELAQMHGLQLATLDANIPLALVLPPINTKS